MASLPDLSDEDERGIIAEAESDPDAPPLDDAQLARMRPMHEAQPELLAKLIRRKRGRPPLDRPEK